jgi:hypothetical protein
MSHPIPQETRNKILELLSEGKSLRTACTETGVHLQTALFWCRQDEEWRQAYLNAKQEGADALADSISELADQAIREPEKANAIRVAIEAKKWIASKLKPKSYGDRIEQHVIDETKSPGEVADRIKALRAELGDLLKNKEEENKEENENEGAEAVQSALTSSTTPAPNPLH